nr:glycosyltransferase [Mammaliicoccus sciuri]
MLYDFHSKDYIFDNKNELVAFFYEHLYKDGDLFFSDKTAITSPSFLLTDSKIPVISVLHSTHVKDNNDIEGSDIKNIYGSVFNHLERFSGILVSTLQQKKDVEKRIQSKIPVYNIPVGYAQPIEPNYSPTVPDGPIKLMSIARYSPEKQLEHQIRLVDKLKEDFEQIELHLFGFGSELNKLKELVDSLSLEEHVKFRGFIPNITKEMHKFHVSMITSNMEGFALALLESLSNGLPAISYDIPYGPSELIVNGKNGYLVPRNDEDNLYETVKSYLSNPELQKTFRDNCMTESQKYAQSEIIKKWLHLLGEVKS